jgi:hypothetical protein
MNQQNFCSAYTNKNFMFCDRSVEVLYAILPSGQTIQSKPEFYSNSFDGRSWVASTLTTEEIKNFEFIGNYKTPKL